MLHTKRRWGVGPACSPEDLACKLTERTWTLCTGFYVAGHPDYLFLNDATHEDGAGEWAVIKGGLGAQTHLQVESITFSWCEAAQALRYIQQALAGDMDRNRFARPVQMRIEPMAQHGTCHLCA